MSGPIHPQVNLENQFASNSGTSPASYSGTGGISSRLSGFNRWAHDRFLGCSSLSSVIEIKSSFDFSWVEVESSLVFELLLFIQSFPAMDGDSERLSPQNQQWCTLDCVTCGINATTAVFLMARCPIPTHCKYPLNRHRHRKQLIEGGRFISSKPPGRWKSEFPVEVRQIHMQPPKLREYVRLIC